MAVIHGDTPTTIGEHRAICQCNAKKGSPYWIVSVLPTSVHGWFCPLRTNNTQNGSDLLNTSLFASLLWLHAVCDRSRNFTGVYAATAQLLQYFCLVYLLGTDEQFYRWWELCIHIYGMELWSVVDANFVRKCLSSYTPFCPITINLCNIPDDDRWLVYYTRQGCCVASK